MNKQIDNSNNQGKKKSKEPSGFKRNAVVSLDPEQHLLDASNSQQGENDMYFTFNLLMRRKPKENNFKAMLKTIKDIMNEESVIPQWLHHHTQEVDHVTTEESQTLHS
jgi:intron-binding protein aquarius